MNPVFAFLSPGLGEMLVIGIIAVLLFGKRLPEVGRTLGRGLVEFRKGLYDIQDEIGRSSYTSEPTSDSHSETFSPELDREEPTAPRFEPPSSEPRERT